MDKQNTEGMNLPLKNKESLDDKNTLKVSKTKYRYLIIVAAFSFIVSFSQILLPFIIDVITSEEKKLLIKKQQEDRYQKFIDSIQEIQDIKTQEETYKNISKIHDYMDQLRKQLPNSSRVSLYYTHDSGGVPVSGSELNVTILYTANNTDPCLGKNYWQDKPIPEGYFNFNYELFKKGFIYIPDVTKREDIYLEETKEDIDCSKSKAIMGTVLKKTSYGVYFLVVDWSIDNSYNKNLSSRLILKKYASLITPLIQGKKK